MLRLPIGRQIIYTYEGEFLFDASLALVKASSDIKFYTSANWDKDTHSPLDASKVYEEMKTEVKDIVFGEREKVNNDNSSIEVDDYFVASIKGLIGSLSTSIMVWRPLLMLKIDNSNSTAVTTAVEATDDGAILVLTPLTIGEATISFKTEAKIREGEADYASNQTSIKETVLAKKPVDPAEQAWQEAASKWENTAPGGVGIPLPIPGFEFTDVEITQEYQGLNAVAIVKIYTELNNCFGYASTLLSKGYTWVSETSDSVSLSYEAYSVTVSYDESGGFVSVTFIG